MSISHISKKEISPDDYVLAKDLKPGIFKLIKDQYPDFDESKCISLDELNQYRRLYLSFLLEQERGDLAKIDLVVMDAFKNNAILSENIVESIEEKTTRGQKMADKIANFGGSWKFIITFFSFIVVWIIINVLQLSYQPFDPYPFILLNLILSCLASIQAPIIMMSQNRQEEKDRQRGEHDYKINLKAELEIKLISDKIDHLITQQNRKLLEIQEVQMDYLGDLIKQLKNNETRT